MGHLDRKIDCLTQMLKTMMLQTQQRQEQLFQQNQMVSNHAFELHPFSIPGKSNYFFQALAQTLERLMQSNHRLNEDTQQDHKSLA